MRIAKQIRGSNLVFLFLLQINFFPALSVSTWAGPNKILLFQEKKIASDFQFMLYPENWQIRIILHIERTLRSLEDTLYSP